MRVHDPLDKILNNEIKVKILRFLCKTEAEWSGRQIAQEIKVSPAACHKSLRELNNERVLLLRSIGKSYLYRLNKENFIISDLLKPLYEKENKIPEEIYEAIVKNISPLVIKGIERKAIMAVMKKVKSRELFMGKLSHSGDLLEEITDICQKKNIQLGRIEALGAVQKARLAFYNQQTREYQFFIIDQPLEITKLVGNISLKDGTPIVHVHVTLADKTGKTYGGHLAPGTVIFACEFILEVFEGPIFERGFDEETGLPLWAMSE